MAAIIRQASWWPKFAKRHFKNIFHNSALQYLLNEPNKKTIVQLLLLPHSALGDSGRQKRNDAPLLEKGSL